MINQALKSNFQKLQDMYSDFLSFISEDDLSKKLLRDDSNMISQHLRCIGGGRETLKTCLPESRPFEWTCSLNDQDLSDLKKVSRYVLESGDWIINFIEAQKSLDEHQVEMIFDTINHEYMHQGQLVRYLIHYEMGYPETWDKQWYFSYS